MKLAIMQPYLFPYIGYFQLLNAVEHFIVYDDVQYMKGSWINRNRILVNQKEHLFTFSVKHDSLESTIDQRYFSNQHQREKEKFYKTLQANYSSTPQYKTAYTLIQEVLEYDTLNISEKITHSLKCISNYLGLRTRISRSSDLRLCTELDNEKRVIGICEELNASVYINPIGGLDLYSKENFNQHGINLLFIKTRPFTYNQGSDSFVANLSIVDLLMHLDREEIKQILNEYELI